MFTTRNLFLTTYSALLLAISTFLPLQARAQPLQASSGQQETPADQPVLWESDRAKHLIGMPEVRPKVEGKLIITQQEIMFDKKGLRGTVPISDVTAVHVGDEKVEKGGVPARLIKMAIPYGGGAAVSAVYRGQVDILTIEFHDGSGSYHGMVFQLQKD